MVDPASKRRRVDAASSTLSRPFRSPIKAPSKVKQSRDDQPCSHSQLVESQETSAEVTSSLSKNSRLQLQETATPLRLRKHKKPFSSPASGATLQPDSDIAPLLKSQRQLEKQLRDVKEEIDLAEQAQKIERDSLAIDPNGKLHGELMELIQKWKVVSRDAAEELFAGVRDRVNRMGGPKAWKQMQERQREFLKGYDEESQRRPESNVDETQDVEQKNGYAQCNIESETANEKKARGGDDFVEEEEEEGNDEFTMSMMLKTLNIDPRVIGYDQELQCWIFEEL